MAIFYKDFGYSAGLIILGQVDADVDALMTPREEKATIEVIQNQPGQTPLTMTKDMSYADRSPARVEQLFVEARHVNFGSNTTLEN